MNPSNLEALNWVNSDSVKDFASNRFDEKLYAVRFIKELYSQGAIEVSINKESIVDETDGLYADAIMVKLPKDLAQKANILRICEDEAQESCDVEITDDSVSLWWD